MWFHQVSNNSNHRMLSFISFYTTCDEASVKKLHNIIICKIWNWQCSNGNMSYLLFLLNFFLNFSTYPQSQVISREVFAQWMEIFRQIAERPVPESTLQVDEDERADLPWWKCKKWALHILYRIFERWAWKRPEPTSAESTVSNL